ncbi:hypothetical protein [uncultured Desulfovibrio sp.]|uniref:hypothetical protein n=1 Tax=uncultured Desulfovibrio sp. TaxID=167968 RepID=UPI002628A378|nr:hypothetical protein [uncultured Desulfovibrio sp.]
MADKTPSMARFQCTTKEVDCRSLPWSLRHSGEWEAIEDARNLAVFLMEVLTSPEVEEMANTNLGNWRGGARLCFELMVDKLDIASGEYAFPLLSHAKDAPCLCRRGYEDGRHE